ncbi:MAG: hypothetical protein QM831_14815 [Kofleriaceae bacterium]
MKKLAIIAFVVGGAHVATAGDGATAPKGTGSAAPVEAAPAAPTEAPKQTTPGGTTVPTQAPSPSQPDGAPSATAPAQPAPSSSQPDGAPSAPVQPAPSSSQPDLAPSTAPAPSSSDPRPAVTAPATSVTTSEPEHDTPDTYYARDRGIGIFHNARVVASLMNGTTPDLMNGAITAPGATRDVTIVSAQFDGVYLALPSAFGNFHGIEFSGGLRSEPIDLWAQLGTAVTLLNLGHGGPGSIRIGGGFGFGFNFAHAYGYVRARAALVVIPRKLDVEASAQWTPPSASTENYDERILRASLWYRPGRSERAYEVFVESLRRDDAMADRDRELDAIGGGIGMTLF